MDLFIGRFQPITIAHQRVIQMMEDPVVVVVSGAKSSKDKKKNPFTVDEQIDMVRKSCPSATVFHSTSGYVPDILEWLEHHQYKINRLYAGDDRLHEYQAQLERDPGDYSIELVEIKRDDTSATQIREAFRMGDIDKVLSLVPTELHGDISKMEKQITENPTNTTAGVATSPKPIATHKRKVKSFKDFIKDKQDEEERGDE